MIWLKRLPLVALSALCLTLAVASADDFAPPPWSRLHPNAITAEWEFLTPANPLGPDGFSNVGIKGSGSVATSALIAGPGGLGWGAPSPDLDGDGGWFFPGGGDIHFTVDNVIDFEPVKSIWLQVTHSPGLGLSLDPLAAPNLGATGAVPGAVSEFNPDPTHTLFVWNMFPNPDWEQFRLLVFGPGEIDQVFLDTISIPEPSSFVLCGIGLVSLGYAARRRPKRA